MLDLSAKIFYKAQFDILGQTNDIFEDVLYVVRSWLTTKYQEQTKFWKWDRFGFNSSFSTHDNYRQQNKVRAETRVYFSEALGTTRWALKIVEKDRDFHRVRSWINEIGFIKIDDTAATVSFLTYYIDKPGYIGDLPKEPEKTVPGFITSFFQGDICPHISCWAGSVKLKNRALCFSKETLRDFLDLVFDEKRKTSVVLISSYRENGAMKYPISPDELAYHLTGNAIVCYGENNDFSFALSREKSDYSCYDGAIRVYRPIADILEDNPHSHFSLSRHKYADQNGRLKSMLIRAFCEQVSYQEIERYTRTETIERLVNKQTYVSLKEKNSQYIKENAVSDDLFRLADNEIKKLEEENNELRDENMQLSDENRRISYDCDSSRKQIAELCGSVRALEKSSSLRDKLSCYPESREDVVDYFRSAFGDRLDFSERGMKSLKTCASSPSLLWSALHAAATVLYDLYMTASCDVESEFQNRTKFSLTLKEGAQTRNDNRLMNLRKDTYHDKEIWIEPHLKKGNDDRDPNAIRIYYDFLEDEKKIIVGHCGTHLPNYTSQFVH